MTTTNTPAVEPETRERGVFWYVISLLVGLPNVALMVYLASDGVLVRLALSLAAASVIGCTLAVAGMRSRPRRFRAAALALTLIPGMAVIAAVAIFVAFLVALIQGGGTS